MGDNVKGIGEKKVDLMVLTLLNNFYVLCIRFLYLLLCLFFKDILVVEFY